MVDRRRLLRAQYQDISITKQLDEFRYKVSGSRDIVYEIDLREPSCTCPDWEDQQPKGGCKHILKVKLERGEVDEPSPSGGYTVPSTSKSSTNINESEYSSNSPDVYKSPQFSDPMNALPPWSQSHVGYNDSKPTAPEHSPERVSEPEREESQPYITEEDESEQIGEELGIEIDVITSTGAILAGYIVYRSGINYSLFFGIGVFIVIFVTFSISVNGE